MKEINDLPIELYSSIFKYLSIKDLFNCRLVNKQFKYSIYESINKLIVTHSFDFDSYEDNTWYYKNETMNEDDLISFECYRKIRSSYIFNLKSSLKYLTIRMCGYRENFADEIIILNVFINLESLKLFIDNEDSISKNFKIEINLKNLKYFILENLYLSWILELNTPKLEKIKYFDTKKLHIKSNPNSIKHLITNDCGDNLKIFENLEIIEFQYWYGVELNENLLSFFKNLKKLKINFIYNRDDDEKDDEIDADCFEKKLIESLINVFNSRIKWNKDIDIYLYDVKLIDIQQLIDIQHLKEVESDDAKIFIYQLNNYDLLESTRNSSISYYYVCQKYSLYDKRAELPSSFFDKYQEVLKVYGRCLQTENEDGFNLLIDNLNWFLNNLKSLRELYLGEGFNQNFFNNLPNSIRMIFICERGSYSKINFDFILKLNRLREIKVIYSDIDLFDISLSAFLNLNYLSRFKFTFRGYEIKIEKKSASYYLSYEEKGSYGFDISKFNCNIFNLSEYDLLVKECYQVRSKIINGKSLFKIEKDIK